MLEIFLVRWLYRSLAEKASLKGRPRSWGWLGVGFWFGGEVMGLIVGVLLGAEELGIYGVALLFAIIGAVVSHVIVGSLPQGALADGAEDTAPSYRKAA